jgi:GPH family glycoside/pentoside/hexuronide:cation symporter
MVLPVAITADVIDFDELGSGLRREGAYFGVWALVMKFAGALASGAVGVALEVLGCLPNETQSASTILGLKVLHGPVPAAMMLLGFVVFLRFPLTRERHAEVQTQLGARRHRWRPRQLTPSVVLRRQIRTSNVPPPA